MPTDTASADGNTHGVVMHHDAARRAFCPVADEPEATRFTRRLVRCHYENFPVVSLLLPRYLRQDFCNVYAFCRLADDLSDEVGDPAAATALLARFREQTLSCFSGRAESAVFVALSSTIRRHGLPIDPFLRLIDAFEQDQRVCRYDTFEALLDYCARSANPVGRLVLHMCGYRDEPRLRLSDLICTALQLTNFWQDVRRDILQRNRIYIPRESMDRFGIGEAQLREGRCDQRFRDLMRFEVERTERMFAEGSRLLPLLEGRVRAHIALYGMGGRAILAAIRRQGYDTLTRRPSLSAWGKAALVLRVIAQVLKPAARTDHR